MSHNKNKFVSINGDLYESIATAAKRAGMLREDGLPDMTGYVKQLLTPLGLETDDVRFIFRVPKVVADDKQQLKLFLAFQVEKVTV